jgi:hypothetical protein
MGRKVKKHPPEGDPKKSMKQLTKDHEKFMAGRNKNRKEEKETGKEDFEQLLEKAVKTKPRST